MMLPGSIDDEEEAAKPPAMSSCLTERTTTTGLPSLDDVPIWPMKRKVSVFSRTVSTGWEGEDMDENTPRSRSNTGWMSIISCASDDTQAEGEAGAAPPEPALARTETSRQEKPRLDVARPCTAEEEHLKRHKFERNMDPGTRKFLAKTLSSNRFCARLRPEELDSIVDAMVYFSFEMGEAVVQEGQDGSYFFVLQDGVLEVLVDGAVNNTLIAGTTFGGNALLYNCPRTATVMATASSSVWAVDGEIFRKVIREWCSKRCAENKRLLDCIGLLDGLTPVQKDRVAEFALAEEGYVAGDRLIEQGDTATCIFCVRSGSLSVIEGAKVNDKGELEGGTKAATLAAGDVFGERSALCGEPLNATIVADMDCEIVCVGVPQLREALGEDLAQCLQRCFLRATVRKVPALAQLTSAQQQRLADAMTVKTYGPGRAIVADALLLIVIDGSMCAKDVTLDRGDFWQDESLLQMEGKKFDKKQARHISGLRSGRAGCKVSVLQAQAASKALKGSGATGPADGDSGDFVKKVLLARKAPIFRELSEDQIKRLACRLVLRTHSQGDKIFEQGEPGRAFFVISEGEAQVTAGGRRLRTLAKGACFGERAVLLEEPRAATVEITSETAEMLCLDRDEFRSIVPKDMIDELTRRTQMSDKAITLKSLRHIRSIGAGSYGSVRLVEHRRARTRYALKRVKKKDGSIPEEVRRECVLLAEIDHPFILRLVATFETDKGAYMLTELITGGELFTYTNKQMATLSRKHAQFYVGSLIIILEHLHERGIVYRDLKPENVMLDAQGYLKLVDFGFAKKLDVATMRTYSLVGTLLYLAPELIRGNGYGTSVDVWSLGVMFYELVAGRMPFGEGRRSEHDILVAVLEEPLRFPSKYTDSAGKKLIQAMLNRRPEYRLGVKSWEEVKSNKYFKAGVDGDLFDRILGRELEPPIVPAGDQFPEDTGPAILSDSEDLGGMEDVIIARVLEVFKKVKLSGDRQLSRHQLGKVLRVLDAQRFNEEAMARIWRAMGTPMDARVKLDDFLSWMSMGGGEELAHAQALEDIHE